MKKGSWLCPMCGKSIAKGSTRYGSAKGLLVMHIKAKHPKFYPLIKRNVDLIQYAFKRGELVKISVTNLLEAIRKNQNNIIFTSPKS